MSTVTRVAMRPVHHAEAAAMRQPLTKPAVSTTSKSEP